MHYCGHFLLLVPLLLCVLCKEIRGVAAMNLTTQGSSTESACQGEPTQCVYACASDGNNLLFGSSCGRDGEYECEVGLKPVSECFCDSDHKIYTSGVYVCGDRPDGVSPTWVLIVFNFIFFSFIICLIAARITNWRRQTRDSHLQDQNGQNWPPFIDATGAAPAPWERPAVALGEADRIPESMRATIVEIEVDDRSELVSSHEDEDVTSPEGSRPSAPLLL